MTGFLKEIQYLQSEIEKLKVLVDTIEHLHSQQLLPGTEVNLDEVNEAVDQNVSDVSKQLSLVKRHIKKIDEANEKIDSQTQDAQIRVSQTATCRKRFLDTAKRYQEVQQKHRQRFRDRLVREYKIAHPDATSEEVDEALSEEGMNVFADEVLHSTRYGEAKGVLKAVQERHEDVKKIEKTILELNSLFQEMAVAVESQGGLINSIEHSVTNAALYTEEATVHLDKAIEYRKSSRRKLYILTCICCVLLLIVGGIVYSFAIKPFLPSGGGSAAVEAAKAPEAAGTAEAKGEGGDDKAATADGGKDGSAGGDAKAAGEEGGKEESLWRRR